MIARSHNQHARPDDKMSRAEARFDSRKPSAKAREQTEMRATAERQINQRITNRRRRRRDRDFDGED